MDPSFSLTRTIHKARGASRQQEPNITSVERVARNSGHCRLVGSINFKNRGSPAHFPTISSFGVASLCVFSRLRSIQPPFALHDAALWEMPVFLGFPMLARKVSERTPNIITRVGAALACVPWFGRNPPHPQHPGDAGGVWSLMAWLYLRLRAPATSKAGGIFTKQIATEVFCAHPEKPNSCTGS